MIESFADKETEHLWEHCNSQRFQAISRIALRKLNQLNETTTLKDLSVPPGNRLEPLNGDRIGQYSIRVNKQYRICFEWSIPNAYNVEINKHYEN